VKRKLSEQRTPNRSFVLPSPRHSFLGAVLVMYFASAAHAVTLDTPPLLGLTLDDRFICTFINLDPNKTAILNASGSAGLIQDDGVMVRAFQSSVSVPPGQTATTLADYCHRSDSLLVYAPACHCHFEFTGVSKSKVRAALSTNISGSVTAY
jgi:hypothetical protein